MTKRSDQRHAGWGFFCCHRATGEMAANSVKRKKCKENRIYTISLNADLAKMGGGQFTRNNSHRYDGCYNCGCHHKGVIAGVNAIIGAVSIFSIKFCKLYTDIVCGERLARSYDY